MAIRSRFQQDEGTPEINLSPMIDCIFILLIFFIVTTVFVEEVGLNVNKPQASSSMSMEDKESVSIEITKGDEILLDGAEIQLASLGARIHSAITRDEEIPVTITANKNSSQGIFAQVWSVAHQSGAKNLSFTTTN
ncbi:biopolymer transporter ExbD [Ruficoccus amylovorans]|uniref:Biopolymer transporter ExbD n=1 Tax=Ruficoccus amylovorans TaxID=1804625 RepID=A0A842HH11_9BACT|nr:biopolymer transporter ExbD [Ruficoccus amylovorans]MBC2594837.1 biopolymer transporter ExbD [Ruficoccus amylovorans]